MTLAAWADGARWALAGIFVVAAITKVVQRGGLAARARDVQVLGVPARISSVVAWVLPLGEAGLAVLLVVVPARWPVGLALVLLLLLTLLAARTVRRGVATPCRCFGGLTARPLSWRTVVRNGGLMTIGLVALVPAAGIGPPTWWALAWFALAFVLVVLF